MNRKQITCFNIFSITCILLLFLVNRAIISSQLLPLQILLASFIVLILPGINLTYVIENITKRSFDLSVFINISLLSSLLIPPLLLASLYQYLDSIDLFLTLVAYMSFMLLPYLWHFFSSITQRWISFPESKTLLFPRISLRTLISHPVFLITIIAILVHYYNLTRYSFLPAPDSYSWLIDFEGKLPVNNMPLTTDPGRRSFSAFIAAFFYLGRINLYHLFKYFLPFLSLIVIAPMWLMARQLPKYSFKIIFLLATVLISPTIILEFEFIRQQVLFLIFLYFSVGLQTYAIYKKDSSIFYLIGVFSLFGTTIHPAFLLLALSWIFTFILSHVKTLWRHKYKVALITALAFPWAEKVHIVNMYVRIREQAGASFENFISGNWNLRFPAHYISADAYEMSWPGLIGVLKYYSYYAGPLSFLILVTIVGLILFNSSFRKNIFSFFTKAPFLNIFFPLTLFLIIAEIAPRFGNIAFLPDRAWQYISILLIFPFFLILLQFSSTKITLKKTSLLVTIIIATVITFSGATYINHLTKYTAPDYEFIASRWILNNTDARSQIYSSSSKNVIRYHSQRKFIGFDDSIYNEPNPNKILSYISSQLSLESDISANLTNVSGLFSDISSRAISAKGDLSEAIKYRHISLGTYDSLDAVLTELNNSVTLARDHVSTAREFHKTNILGIDSLPPTYIYYARTHPKNPYSSRPYKSSFTTNLNVLEFPALDNNPNIFERVYTDSNKVAIWRVKTNSLNNYDLPALTP